VTFASVGSPVAIAGSTFTLAPAAVGHFVIAEVACSSSTVSATALSSSNATWTQLVAPTTLSANTQIVTVFLGKVTSTSSATVTVSFSGTAPTVRGAAQEFSTTVGNSSVTLNASGTVNSATANYPTLTPTHGSGELYFGFAFNSSSAVSGSTSGYTYNASADGHNNGLCYNANCANSAQTPAWGDSNSKSGIAVLVYEAVTSHTATASLTVTPSFSATPSARTRSASLTVTPSLSAAASGFPSNALLLEDGTPILLEDGSFLLDESPGGSSGHSASASLTVAPVLSSARAASHAPSASLTVTPSLSASRAAGRVRSASLTVTPAFSASRAAVRVRAASLTVTPALSVTTSHAAGAPPGYPDGKLDAKLELLLSGAWTDVTRWAMPDGPQNASIKSGQPDGAQQPNPAAMALTLDNGDYRFSPRNSAGPYAGQLRQNTPARVSVASPYGTYLRLEQNNSDRAFVNDTLSLHVTSSLELRIELCLSDWRASVLAARYDNTQPSWYLLLNDNGTLTWSWFDSGGTQHTATTTQAVPFTSGITAYRVVLNGPSGLLDLYVGDGIDGTYAHIGAGFSIAGGSTTVRAGNAPLVVGWSGNLSAGQLLGQVTACRLYNGIAGSGGTIAAQGTFSGQVPGVTSWADSAGNTWNLAGGAEISARDYRLTGELSSISPTATVSSSASTRVTISGRTRRLQAGSQPSVMSPMKRAVLAQSGTLAPVDYWPMEDGLTARSFGPAVGTSLLTLSTGNPQAAADSTFEASAPLPTLGNGILTATVDSYTATNTWAVRFLLKTGTLPAPAAEASICKVQVASGTGVTVRTVDLHIDSANNLRLYGLNGSGGTVFATTWTGPFPLNTGVWMSVEATVSGGNTAYSAVTVQPGATSGISVGSGAISSAAGRVSSVTFNADGFFTDTVLGHASVQKAWVTLFSLGSPLNAWRGELAATRFARICAENGIPCRIAGRPATTQQMGPQPRGSVWTVLRDCAQTEQGLLYEPLWACNGVGLRTRESLGSEQPDMVTLDFSASNLPGNLSPADDDQGFLNDVTGQMATGETWREVLDDGSAKSVSEPEAGGAGRYAGSVPFPINVADASMLQSNVAFYLGRSSVDEARYRQVAADCGIPGAPAAAIARLRPGDRVKLVNVPAAYQTDDIRQLVTGATEVLGPGRKITWDCVPASPYD
jgi:hypothetical protein